MVGLTSPVLGSVIKTVVHSVAEPMVGLAMATKDEDLKKKIKINKNQN